MWECLRAYVLRVTAGEININLVIESSGNMSKQS